MTCLNFNQGFVYNTYYFLARMIGILENQVKWDDILHLGEFGSFLKMFKWDDNCQSEIPISGSNETLLAQKMVDKRSQ